MGRGVPRSDVFPTADRCSREAPIFRKADARTAKNQALSARVDRRLGNTPLLGGAAHSGASTTRKPETDILVL